MQDLQLKQHQGNFEPRVYRPSTTFTPGAAKQPKASKTHQKASQKAGMAVYIDNMSQILTPCRTIPPPKVNTSHSTKRPTSERHQNGHSHCCMHVHQTESQVCKPGETLALRKVQHPHNSRTSVNRFPLTKQEILSHYSGCFEGIGHFPGDLYKFHLKPDHKPTIHASQKQEIPLQVNTENVNTHWVHSYRTEHAEHFPAPMETCMDNHHTQTTERTQQQHLQDIGHTEFPPGMESTSIFPGDQFQQGNEEIMDTGTFTSGSTILNRYPALSTHTHQGMENSNTEAFPCFNFYADSTPQMETSRQRPGADSTPSGKGTTVTSR